MIQVGGTQVNAGSTLDTIGTGFPGAKVGDCAIAHPAGPLDSTWNGITWSAYIPAADEIVIRLANLSGGNLTPTPTPFAIRKFSNSASGY
jgi:hypothetical protein